MSITAQGQFEVTNPLQNLDDDNIVFILKFLVEIFKELNPKLFKDNYNAGPGRKKVYKTYELLAFVTWGNLKGVKSSRKLKELIKDNNTIPLELLNQKEPGRTTIDDFIRIKKDLITEFDLFLKEFLVETGIAKGEIVHADGTILKAYCNKWKKMYSDQVKYLKKLLEKLYEDYKENNDDGLLKLKHIIYSEKRTEKEEEFYTNLKKRINSNGMNLLKLALKDEKSYHKIIKRLEHMLENINGDHSISTVDPEARHMMDKKKIMGLNYNYQIAVDDKSGVILAHYITQNTTDHKETIPITEKLNKLLNKPRDLVVDTGYWYKKALHKLYYEKNTKLVIPDRTEASHRKSQLLLENKVRYDAKEERKEKYKRHNFKYNPEKDVVIYPEEKILKRTGHIRKGEDYYIKYSTDDCLSCSKHDYCTEKRKREVKILADPILIEHRKVYHSEEGQDAFSRRGIFAEGGFGALNESRNFRGIKRRGVENANLEMTLTVTTHNLLKVKKFMDVKVLKIIYNEIKKRKKNGLIRMEIFKEWKDKYTIENNKIVDLKI